jgi:hypothetical protein
MGVQPRQSNKQPRHENKKCPNENSAFGNLRHSTPPLNLFQHYPLKFQGRKAGQKERRGKPVTLTFPAAPYRPRKPVVPS